MATDPTRVTYKGPFFRTPAGKVVRKAINKAIIETSKDGVREVKSDLRKSHGKDTGEYRRSIKRKKRGFTSRVFSRMGMISAWLEGTSRRNRNTRFKGYQLWSRAFERTNRKADKTRQDLADLIVRELGGR